VPVRIALVDLQERVERVLPFPGRIYRPCSPLVNACAARAPRSTPTARGTSAFAYGLRKSAEDRGLGRPSPAQKYLPFASPRTGKNRPPAADTRRPRDWRCVLVGWLIVIIIVIPILAIIGLVSIVRGIGRRV
jgi:hypothetical protein